MLIEELVRVDQLDEIVLTPKNELHSATILTPTESRYELSSAPVGCSRKNCFVIIEKNNFSPRFLYSGYFFFFCSWEKVGKTFP